MTNLTSNERCTTRNDSLGPPQLSNILILSIFYENMWKNLLKKIFNFCFPSYCVWFMK